MIYRFIVLLNIYIFVVNPFYGYSKSIQQKGSVEQFLTMNPIKVAQYEVNTWKSYYQKDQKNILLNISEFLKHFFQVDLSTNSVKLFTKAVIEFSKLPQSTLEDTYKIIILPLLEDAFEALKTEINKSFNIKDIAQAEMMWWVSRRQQNQSDPKIVGLHMARMYSLFFGGCVDDYKQAAFLRAFAAYYRDLCQDEYGGIRERDWDYIEKTLEESYRKLTIKIQKLM